jgi:hypothetical protein
MYFIDLSRIDNDIQYLESRFNWVIGGFAVATIAFPFILRGLAPYQPGESQHFYWTVDLAPFLMMIIGFLATAIPTSKLRIVERFIPSEIGKTKWESVVWLYKRTLVAMWIIFISSVIASIISHFFFPPFGDPLGSGMVYVGCIMGSANYLQKTIKANKVVKAAEITSSLNRLKWSCAFIALLYLVALLYPQVREFLPADIDQDDFSLHNYFLYIGYLFLILGIVISFLNPDSIPRWVSTNEGVFDLPDTPAGKKAKHAMQSVLWMFIGPLIAFIAFLITGSMLHLNIMVPVFLVMAFWIINRAELQDSHDLPMTSGRTGCPRSQ